MDEGSSLEKIAKLVTCAWAMWGNRNEIRMGGQHKSGQALVLWAAQYLEEFYVATGFDPDTSSLCIQGALWTPPLGSMYKKNVDGVVFSDLKAVGVGVVIKDDKGRVVAAFSKKNYAPLGPVEAEA